MEIAYRLIQSIKNNSLDLRFRLPSGNSVSVCSTPFGYDVTTTFLSFFMQGPVDISIFLPVSQSLTAMVWSGEVLVIRVRWVYGLHNNLVPQNTLWIAASSGC